MSDFNNILKKVKFFEKLALYGKKESFLKKVAQNILDDSLFETLKTPGPTQEPTKELPKDESHPYYVGKPRVYDKETKEFKGNLTQQGLEVKSPNSSQVYEAQAQLNSLLERNKNPLPKLQLDGKLGDKTRKALEWFKNKFPQYKNLSDLELFDKLKYETLGLK